MLINGYNIIAIRFTNDYVSDGNGFHSFTDIDKK